MKVIENIGHKNLNERKGKGKARVGGNTKQTKEKSVKQIIPLSCLKLI